MLRWVESVNFTFLFPVNLRLIAKRQHYKNCNM